MRTCTLILIALVSILNLRAQGPTYAALHGTITDPSGAVIAGASIAAKPHGNEAAFNAVSDASGQFTLSRLVPGSYDVAAEQTGFNRVYRTLTLAPDKTTEVALTLPLNVVTQSVEVSAQTVTVTETPTAQTITSVDRQDTKDAADFTIQESLELVPGITTITGNGPRDISISLRGSNDRQTYGIRNALLFEDGFQVTQPDGLGRADLTDPHAYESIDAVQGPSSTMYGNNANDGAIFFHTRPGAEINGIEFGTDVGSYQFVNNYVTIGHAGESNDFSIFLSNVRGKQSYQDHFAFNTATANILARFSIGEKDRITVKFINNDLDTALPIRLSLNQFHLNPFQQGCVNWSTSTPSNLGCATISVYANGFAGTKASLSADQAGLGRNDRRTIVGGRWEHDLTSNTTWRTQGVWDVKDINQPTGATSARGTTPSFILLSDGTRKGLLFGRSSTTYGGGFDWHPLPKTLSGLRFRTAYQLDLQVYRDYTERLSTGKFSTAFVRNGNRIPGVVPNNLNARLAYEKASGRYGNIGSYVEANERSTYWLDNANLIYAPCATVFNYDIHYDPAPGHGIWSRTHFYFDLQNLANRTFVGSAGNISDSLSSSTGLQNGTTTLMAATGSIYAGAPRMSIGGFRIKF